MKKILIFVLLLETITYCQNLPKITFSEIMFNSVNGNNEFIEIYNYSDKDTIDLSGYKLCYPGAKADTIKAVNFTNKILPLGYAVILENDYDLQTGIYSQSFNSNTHIFKISDGNFGAIGMSNTTNKAICLLSSKNDTISKYTYTANNPTGISDEKIIMNANNSASNWSNSQIVNGTPGCKNSVTPREYDVAIKSMNIIPNKILYNSEIKFSLNIHNYGTKDISFSLKLSVDTDHDAVEDSIIWENKAITILASDSLVYELPVKYKIMENNLNFIAAVECKDDENLANNMISKNIKISCNYNDIVVNEIMYAPNSGEPEWIELFNRTAFPINLNGCRIKDFSESKSDALGDIILNPNDYLIIAKNNEINNYYNNVKNSIVLSTMPVLNNDKDAIILLDNNGFAIDSVNYQSSWGGLNGTSLERISVAGNSLDKCNWTSSKSIEKSTPGNINSVTIKNYDLKIDSVTYLPKYPQINDDFYIVFYVKNIGKNAINSFTCKLINILNNNIEDSCGYNGMLSSENVLQLKFDKKLTFRLNELKKSLRILVISTLDEDLSNNACEINIQCGYKRNSVQISEVMVSPDSKEPEWIEFFNSSNEAINVKGWEVEDIVSPTKATLALVDCFIAAKEYFIITKDTVKFYQKYDKSLVRGRLFQCNIGTLTLDDGVIIYDANGSIIDSLRYSGFNIKTAKSIERISFNESTNKNNNWVVSLKHSTPFYGNSYSELPTYRYGSVVFSEIMYDPDSNNSEYIELYNKTDKINIAGWSISIGSENYVLADTQYVVGAKQYYLLLSDSNAVKYYSLNMDSISNCFANKKELGLTEDGKNLYLKDAHNNIIDSMFYSYKLHKVSQIKNNRSLEKINLSVKSDDPQNWGTCLSTKGGTPGLANSIKIENVQDNSSISISPNPFSPDNDGYEDYTTIDYNLTALTNQIRIRIFDNKGRLIRTIADGKYSAAKDKVIFDGRDDNGNALKVGIYIVLLEGLDSERNRIDIKKTTVVVGKK